MLFARHPSQFVVKDRCWRTRIAPYVSFLSFFCTAAGWNNVLSLLQRTENMKQTLAMRYALKDRHLTRRCQGLLDLTSCLLLLEEERLSSVLCYFLFIARHGMQANKCHDGAQKKTCSEDLWLLVHTLRCTPLPTSFSPQEPCAENVG